MVQQPITVPPAVPHWSFAPSWENPRVRRLMAATIVYHVVVLPITFGVYHFFIRWPVWVALIVTMAVGIISLASTLTWSGPMRRQLVVNPFGLYYRISRSHSVRATWDDVESVGRYRWLWFPAEEGVFLRQAAQMSTPLMGLYGRWGRFVPLSLFDEHWQSGEIGGLIRQHAPWLLDGTPV